MLNTTLLEELVRKAKLSNDEETLKMLGTDDFKAALNTVLTVTNQLGVSLDGAISPEYDVNFKISRALISNYITIYYVNILTGEYIGYSSNDNYKLLRIQESGTDFFSDLKKNADRVIYIEDIDMVKDALSKEKLLKETDHGKDFNLVYRLIINDEPTYVSLKAIKLSNSSDNIVIGVSNIDEQKRNEIEAQKRMEKNITYSNIALALARNFQNIYYVNTETNGYVEYNLDNENQTLTAVSYGDEFFEESKVNARVLVYHEDQEKFLNALVKENLLNEIQNGKTFRLTYRLVFNGKAPQYHSLAAINLINDDAHIIIAVSNIDNQMRKEIERTKELEEEKKLARTDALTGALNKYSYGEMEQLINKKIKKKSSLDIALVVADTNNLKVINDTFGHDAGDRCLIETKNILSATFRNSSIYRIGGDEFVVLVEGSDFYKRDYLLEKLQKLNLVNKKVGGVVIACGMSDFNKETDQELVNVFIRADEEMYKNKRMLKENDKQ